MPRPESAPAGQPAAASAPAPESFPPAVAQPEPPAPESTASPAAQLAAGLLDTIPSGARLALRPLDPRETGLPREVGARLYESVLNAVGAAAAGHDITVLARERLHEVYDSLEEFYQGDIESMLHKARADVEIICKASPVAKGVNLSCAAVDLVETVNVAHAMAVFPLDRPAVPYDIAVAEIARLLADGAPAVGPGGAGDAEGSLDRGRAETSAPTSVNASRARSVRLMEARARREGNEARVRGGARLRPRRERGGPALPPRREPLASRREAGPGGDAPEASRTDPVRGRCGHRARLPAAPTSRGEPGRGPAGGSMPVGCTKRSPRRKSRNASIGRQPFALPATSPAPGSSPKRLRFHRRG